MKGIVSPGMPAGRWLRAAAVVVGIGVAVATTARGQEPEPPPNAAAAAVEALRRQDFARALEIVEETRPALAAAKGEDDPAVLTLRILGAQAEYGLGRPEGAVATLDPFLRGPAAGAVLVSPASDWNALNVLGDSYMALGRWDEALRCLERAFGLVAGEESPAERMPGRSRGVDRATTLGKIGTAKARLGDWEGAKASFQAQADALATEPDGGGPYLAAAHSGLGLVADNTGDHATASLHYAEAAKIYDQAFGPDHPYAKRARETLARTRGRGGEAGVAVPSSAGETGATGAADVGAPAARWGWPAVAAVAAAGILGWLVWSGYLLRPPGLSGRPDDSAGEG